MLCISLQAQHCYAVHVQGIESGKVSIIYTLPGL